jgi:hypothetical protein
LTGLVSWAPKDVQSSFNRVEWYSRW